MLSLFRGGRFHLDLTIISSLFAFRCFSTRSTESFFPKLRKPPALFLSQVFQFPPAFSEPLSESSIPHIPLLRPAEKYFSPPRIFSRFGFIDRHPTILPSLFLPIPPARPREVSLCSSSFYLTSLLRIPSLFTFQEWTVRYFSMRFRLFPLRSL